MKTRKIEFVDRLRYASSGDYFNEDTQITIQIVNQKNDDYNFLIGLHEYIEQYLTGRDGIEEPDILEYDLNSKDEDPGSNPLAPYHRQHMISELCERILANWMDVDWKEYEENIIVSR